MRIVFKLQWLFLFHYVINGLGKVQLYIVVPQGRDCIIVNIRAYVCLFFVFLCAARPYTGRQKSRESDVCKVRLKPRVFRRFCKRITSCENDKDCRKPNEICICDKDCGSLCLNPSKCYRFAFKIHVPYGLQRKLYSVVVPHSSFCVQKNPQRWEKVALEIFHMFV